MMNINKTNILNPSYSLSKEFMLTNSNGSYFRTSIVGCNTRRSDGLLVVKKHANNFVLLSSLDEKIVQNGCEYNLGVHKYPGSFWTEGLIYLNEVELNPVPKATYCMGPISFSKELILLPDEDTILIRYKLLETTETSQLLINPLLALRKIHELTQANCSQKPIIKPYKKTLTIQPSCDVPGVFIQSSANFKYNRSPCWHYNVEYENDLKLGLKSKEDLFMPGTIEFTISPNKPIILSASTHELNTESLAALFEQNYRLKLLKYELKEQEKLKGQINRQFYTLS